MDNLPILGTIFKVRNDGWSDFGKRVIMELKSRDLDNGDTLIKINQKDSFILGMIAKGRVTA